MKIADFLVRAHVGRVRIALTDGQVFHGSFRTDILTPSALSAYFYGDERDLSLPIAYIASVEALAHESIAS